MLRTCSHVHIHGLNHVPNWNTVHICSSIGASHVAQNLALCTLTTDAQITKTKETRLSWRNKLDPIRECLLLQCVLLCQLKKCTKTPALNCLTTGTTTRGAACVGTRETYHARRGHYNLHLTVFGGLSSI